ncbi:C4-dicarboxylate ABC transporter [bacterium LRH843]|nr:C4-dicarboxylate ABC transporter [bacterium LRH843]
MGKFSKWLFGILTILILVVVSACSSGASDRSKPADAPVEEGKEASSAKEKYEINLAFGNQPDEPVGQLAQKWKELAAERSNGAIELKLYPSSQLGSEQDVVEQARMGNNVIIMAGYGFLMDYVPDAGIFDAPYLVDNFDELLYLTTTDWFDGIRSDLKKKNIEIVTTNTVYGERHLLTNKKVTTPEDLKGLKIRVPNTQIAIQTFEAMGAAATPTPLADLYTSLQQGLVDGAENPLPVLQGVKAQEVSKHLSLTGHQKFILAWIAGTDFIEMLPEDIVQILRETGDEAGDYARTILEEETKAVLAEFEVEGVEIHEVDPESFKELVKPVYDAFPDWTPGLYDEVQELLNKRPK